jgi:hypothetical protein
MPSAVGALAHWGTAAPSADWLFGGNGRAEAREIMKRARRWQCVGLAVLGLMLGTATGCQTNVAGMTLPSGHYLQHPPQYFPPSPAFPLSRELASMEAQEGRGIGAVAPPPPVAVPAPGPAVAPMPAPAAPPVPQPPAPAQP